MTASHISCDAPRLLDRLQEYPAFVSVLTSDTSPRLLGRRGEREPELRNGAPQIATPPSSTAPELRGADAWRAAMGNASD
jgi:hypothetical protein